MELNLLSFILLFHFATVVKLNALGSLCTIKSSNEEGICIHIKECASIFSLYKSGLIRTKPPTICSTTDKSVCCPLNEAVKKTISTPKESKTRISERKCQEYGQLVYKLIPVSSPVLGEAPTLKKINKCMHESVSLITGGTKAKFGEFPHMVHLGYDEGLATDFNCGGSLVSEKFVLTAAHCLYPRGYGAVKFVKVDYINRNQNAITLNVSNIFEHPDYDKRKMNNDIGLLKLERAVELNERIVPICLPYKQYFPEKAIASGFGKTGQFEQSSVDLLKVTLEKFTQEECQKPFGKAVAITNDTMICYGHHNESRDTCGGDSGGPLQFYNTEPYCTYTQIGIVSFGLKKCGTIGAAGAYTNVNHFLDWIENIVWNNEK